MDKGLSPDQQAQLDQLRADAKALRIDLSALRASGADSKLVDAARAMLALAVQFATKAIRERGLTI